MIKEIVDAVTIPVMAKVRIGHFVEAQVSFYIHPSTLHMNVRTLADSPSHWCRLH
jgi:pyridoxal 5'-phosphate synthase pdxS subunit